MTYAQIKANNVKLLLVDEVQAGAMCGKVTVFGDLREKFKLKPVVQKRSVLLFSSEQIEEALHRLIRERTGLGPQLNA